MVSGPAPDPHLYGRQRNDAGRRFNTNSGNIVVVNGENHKKDSSNLVTRLTPIDYIGSFFNLLSADCSKVNILLNGKLLNFY